MNLLETAKPVQKFVHRPEELLHLIPGEGRVAAAQGVSGKKSLHGGAQLLERDQQLPVEFPTEIEDEQKEKEGQKDDAPRPRLPETPP